MSWRIALSDLRITPAQRQAVDQVLDAGWLSMGPSTAAFEEAFAAAAGVAHAVAVSSATTGLLLALDASGIGPGDEVILPSLTFVADANVVRKLGATPVLVDIAAVDRPLIDPEAIRAAVTERTRAVMVVHYAGYRFPVESIADLSDQGITIIEDAAHATGPVADDGGWMAWTGDMAVFSFFANKNLPLGEGGMITTADDEVARRLRLLRSHGMTTGTWDRHRGHASDYDVSLIGWNCRPTELAAALGTAGLVDLPGWNADRRRLLGHYHRALASAAPDGPHLIFEPDLPTTGHLAVALLAAGQRPAVRAALADAGIQSSFHYPPIHTFSAYGDDLRFGLARTDEAEQRFISLPLHPWLEPSQVDEIVGIVVAADRPAG